jgi:phosphatidate cytidylyltransferase
MAAAALALVAFDRPPHFPGLAVLLAGLGVVSVRELRRFVPTEVRPRAVVTTLGVLAVLAANWSPDPWPAVALTLAGAVLVAATREVVRYTGDGTATGRLVGTVFALAYLGLLPAFLVQLRWRPDGDWAVLATVFVPKVGDIGAYFTGRLVGRHPMAPTLSPKKTWEGLAGGLAAAAGVSLGLPLFGSAWEAVGFGLAVGGAGVVGDLVESVLKRDARVKDASRAVPGFGGVLDVIDSVLFAAPVAYLWLTARG